MARVKGLEYMNDDPNAVDVLYAKIELEDASNRCVPDSPLAVV